MGRIADFARRSLSRKLSCSFCRRRSDVVGRLVAGASAYICDACVIKCVAVLEQHGGMTPTASQPPT